MNLPNGASFPSEQRSLLVEHLIRDIRASADEAGVDVTASFLDIAIRDLGFDIAHGFRVDGSSDFGFDYIEVSEDETTVVQSKGLDANTLNAYDGTNSFGPERIGDIARIINILRDLENIPSTVDLRLKRALEELREQIVRAQKAASADTSFASPSLDEHVYHVKVIFVGLASTLTPQAQQEFDKISKPNSFTFGDISVRLECRAVLIDDLLSERWRKENTKWKDRTGKSKEKVRLTVSEGQLLRSPNSIVFFTKAMDLVRAYEDFGYQIFEPNVRAEIHNSPVNKEIKRSVAHARGRVEFKHLNNGITIIANSFSNVGPKDQVVAIDVLKPGIVNGLQTVKSVHDGYKELATMQDKEHFENKCLVLCRIHDLQSVRDINLLIQTTNNQNAMKPRNLRSNNPEQIIYEQLFAELNWFFQRKEGSWRAFKENPKGWPKLRDKNIRDFRSGKAERVVDNEDLAQNWLSFIGYSKEAINERKAIFAPDRDDLYRMCFLCQPSKHAFHLNYRLREGVDKARSVSPSASALLFAQLSRELYEALVPAPKDARNEAMLRLGISGSKGEIEVFLSNDEKYMTGRVLNGTKTLFVEFVGYICLHIWGDGFQSFSKRLMEKGAFGELYRNHKIEAARLVIENKIYDENEAMICVFELYRYCIYRLVTDPGWKRQYDAALTKSRFLYEDKNRHRLIEELHVVDQLVSRRGLGEPWSDIFDAKKGVFEFFKALS